MSRSNKVRAIFVCLLAGFWLATPKPADAKILNPECVVCWGSGWCPFDVESWCSTMAQGCVIVNPWCDESYNGCGPTQTDPWEQGFAVHCGEVES